MSCESKGNPWDEDLYLARRIRPGCSCRWAAAIAGVQAALSLPWRSATCLHMAAALTGEWAALAVLWRAVLRFLVEAGAVSDAATLAKRMQCTSSGRCDTAFRGLSVPSCTHLYGSLLPKHSSALCQESSLACACMWRPEAIPKGSVGERQQLWWPVFGHYSAVCALACCRSTFCPRGMNGSQEG